MSARYDGLIARAQEVVEARLNNTGNEPSVSVFLRAVDRLIVEALTFKTPDPEATS